MFRLIELLEIRTATQDQSLIQALNFLVVNEDKRVELVPSTLDLYFASVQWQNTVMVKESGSASCNSLFYEQGIHLISNKS